VNWINWLNTVGLLLGVIGAFGLALLTKVFITIQPDGTQLWGTPEGMSNDEWLLRNKVLRIKQKYGLPFSYCVLAFGFLLQLLALWIPVLIEP
jgi:ABC-type lipoprotein release transport system permease subunit